ncbi:hypothetical protein KIN20_030264 [Parelaphostrongylus tenuis]|uniref:Uncharacterized protein n=1 Tax=Parelaphostrongylus tenuis TaxID=148309 RepID=A0AAD5R3J4_PARTN|nr:hypothetical protein KIN20_030264 [Parelaphostrongylus tenuis]
MTPNILGYSGDLGGCLIRPWPQCDFHTVIHQTLEAASTVLLHDNARPHVQKRSKTLQKTRGSEDGEPCRDVSHHDCCNIRAALLTVLLYASLIFDKSYY